MYKQRNFSRGSRSNQTRHFSKKKIRSFDPSNVIRKTVNQEAIVVEHEITHAFSDFDLTSKLHDNIRGLGFTNPTPIQDQAIEHIMAGRDVVGVANTGTGKTAAFLIPLINKVVKSQDSRVLIIAPTRELAIQIEKDLHDLSRGMSIMSASCIGGVSLYGQIKRLQRRPNFVVGTPGRLLDLENQHKINFNLFDSIVLDEVDRMLDMGFINDINKIISKFPQKRQSLFFSATLDDSVKSVMSKFINNPVMISVKTADMSTNVHQDVVRMNGRKKTEVLREVLKKDEVEKTLIFMRTKRSADVLHRDLSTSGFQAAVMHGNKSQSQRQRSLDAFGRGNVNILIATDVASRGIDVDDITHVINYDLPESYDVYIHRIGRTGRADKKGIALSFVN